MRKCPNCGYQLSARHTRQKTRHSYFKGAHEYLVGEFAKTHRRLEIFRNSGGEATWFDESDPSTVEEINPATCQGCVEPHLVGWKDGEWHHNVRSHGGKRCDCAGCGLYVCHPWHVAYHNRTVAILVRKS